MPPKLQKAEGILRVAVSEMATLLDLYDMLATLSDPQFMGRMRKTSAYPGFHNTVVSVISNICIKIDALFTGRKKTSIDVKQAINLVSTPPERGIIIRFHEQTSVEARVDAERMINRLSYLKKRLSKRHVVKAFNNIANTRNSRIAHFDYIEGLTFVGVNVRDVQLCLINTGRIVDLLCRVLIQRVHDITKMRELSRAAAKEFADTLLRGATALTA